MITSILLAATVATAEPTICEKMERAAQTIMKERQANESASKLVKSANGNSLLLALIEDAYGYPAYSSDEYKIRAVKQFGNKAYMICVKEFGYE